MFFLLYKYTDDAVFDDFPKISDHFPKIFQNCPEGQTNVPELFPIISENFRRCPKIAEDCRRLPKTFEEDPKMFRWYNNEFKYNLRDKLDITEVIDIFTCEDIISSHVRISYRFYQFVTIRYTTDFYIIKFLSWFFLQTLCASVSIFAARVQERVLQIQKRLQQSWTLFQLISKKLFVKFMEQFCWSVI